MSIQSEFGNDFYFLPLGGSEQFGVNLNVYICNGEMLAIDCGIGFADERFPGIDLLLPDPEFLEDNQHDLKGMIITHAHEDHIGAVAHLWERFRCPLYATKFTVAVLKRKLKERGLRKVEVNVIEPNEAFHVGSFEVHPIGVSHSVPESVSLFIKTVHGNVMHSGDWNLDPAPTIGKPTDADALKAAGKEGLLAYIGDSTNAEVNGFSGSESDVAKGLEAEFKTCHGKIAITTFSSNIGRVHSIAKAAQACDRQVAVIGRSLHNMIGCAKDCGYLADVPEFLDEGNIGFIPDEKLVVIVTGSQGEYRAALAKISRGDHRSMTLNPGDTVIFSSRAIPGNEREINTIKNNLSGAGIRIVTPNDTENKIHVSGHPCRDEIAQMFQWLNPNTVIPVHGERTQLEAHAQFAQSCQVKHTVVPSNGSIIKLSGGLATIVDHIATDVLAVDQKRVIRSDHQSISARRKLQYTGVLHVSVVLDGHGQLLGDPKFETVGLIDPEDPDEEQFEENLAVEIEDILDDMSAKSLKDDDVVAEELRIGLRRFCFHVLGIKPKATIHVLRV